MNDKQWKQLFKRDEYSSDGFSLEINVAYTKGLPYLKKQSIQVACYKAVELIQESIMAEVKLNDPKTKIENEINKKEILSLFPNNKIYVEEIQNGYCSKWCCKHLPWFIITTTIGRFKVGWRKKVIHIEWADTQCKWLSNELFLDEEVTKYNKIIHAWSIEDGKKYINKIFEVTQKEVK